MANICEKYEFRSQFNLITSVIKDQRKEFTLKPDRNLTKTYIVHSSPNGLHSDLEAASEAESNPSDAESISESNNYQTNNCSSVNNGKKIKSSFRSTFNLPGAVKNMLQVHFFKS